MKFSLLPLTLAFLFSCSPDNENYGIKLISIEYSRNSDGKSWKENYFYNANNKLIEVQSFYGLNRYEIEYSNGKLIQFTTYDIEDNSKRYRDSIQYNSEGKIEKYFHFSNSVDQSLPLSSIHEFEYNNSGKLFKESTFSETSGKYTSFEFYYWSADNIVRIEEYNSNNELLYKFFYTYDDRVNYKKDLTIFNLYQPLYQSKNNITTMTANDYYGNLDLLCNPCEWTYKYNLDDFPINIATSWGTELNLIYE